ncbi:MAG: hypothetical protein WBE72_00850 [Terracidiphilus sp.]
MEKAFRVVVLVLTVLWLAEAAAGLSLANGGIRSLWHVALPLVLVLIMVLSLFNDGLNRLIQSTIGAVEYIEIRSSQIEQSLQARYRSEIEQLRSQDFDPLFYLGESFSLLRVFLVFPALMIALMALKREYMTIQSGAKFVLAYPVFIARDKTAIAFPFGLGVKFYTSFQDGTVLVSKNFKNRTPNNPAVVKHAQKGSIGDTWVEHRKGIRELEAEGKQIDRQSSFEFYADVIHKG